MKVELLHPHPLNGEIYGDGPNEEFVANVKQQTVIEPIIVTEDNQILSGHRRWQAAKKAKLREVPVMQLDIASEVDKQRLLLDANRQREKTTEQKLREFDHYRKLEGQKAKVRQGQRSDLRTNLPTSPKGRARDFAAENVGLSGTNAETGLKVLHAIDTHLDTSDGALAMKIKNLLNTAGINAARGEAIDAGWLAKPKPKSSSKKPAATASQDQPDSVESVSIAMSSDHPPAQEESSRPQLAKAELLNEIRRESVRGFEVLEADQLRAFLAAIRDFKTEWLKKQEGGRRDV